MAHTLPDYTTQNRMETIFGQIDSGELAARLGSPSIFDRRGDVLFIEDFESGVIKWTTTLNGVGAVAALSAAWSKSKDQSCILTAGAGAGGYGQISKYFSIPVLGKLGLEVSFTVDQNTTEILFYFAVSDGTNIYQCYFKHDHANSRVQYLDSAAAWQTFADPVNLRHGSSPFHTYKFVGDFNTHYYTRCVVNDTTHDLSAYLMRAVAPAGDPYASFTIRHVSDNAAVKSIYVDDIILTQNEP